jgi:hypothetical protein
MNVIAAALPESQTALPGLRPPSGSIPGADPTLED